MIPSKTDVTNPYSCCLVCVIMFSKVTRLGRWFDRPIRELSTPHNNILHQTGIRRVGSRLRRPPFLPCLTRTWAVRAAWRRPLLLYRPSPAMAAGEYTIRYTASRDALLV
jgi:hypothetical protein